MQAAFRRELHAPSLSDGDEITKVSQLHALILYLAGISVKLQSLFQRGRPALSTGVNCEWRVWHVDGRQTLNRMDFVMDLLRTEAASSRAV
jgi:hypothetical protein